MNKHHTSVLALGLMLLIASCKKMDVQHEAIPTNPEPIAASVEKTSPWKSLSGWASSKAEKFTVHQVVVEDNSITDAVAGKGLVLAFNRNGASVNALPYQQKESGNAFWYYQISKGAITFSVDAYEGTNTPGTTDFAYFVLTPEQLENLESSGHSKFELMQMSFDKIEALVSK